MKCFVHRCQNEDHQGNGVFLHIIDGRISTKLIWICIPCWDTLGQIPEKHSQLYRNVKEWEEQKEGKNGLQR